MSAAPKTGLPSKRYSVIYLGEVAPPNAMSYRSEEESISEANLIRVS